MKVIAVVAFFVVLFFGAVLVGNAQDYRNRPILMVVPYTPGDGTDISCRLLADGMSKLLKTNIIVENRPGAGGSVGVERVVNASRDGNVFLCTSSSPLTVRPNTIEPQYVSYDVMKQLEPLGNISRFESVVLVGAASPYRDFATFVSLAKKAPDGLIIGTPGAGSSGEINMRLIASQTGARFTLVPYKGSSPAVIDLVGTQKSDDKKRLDASAVSLASALPYVRNGLLVPVVISKKDPTYPSFPTMKEMGYMADILGIWVGVFYPIGVPVNARNALIGAVREVAVSKVFAEKVGAMNMTAEYVPPNLVREIILHESTTVKEEMFKNQKK